MAAYAPQLAVTVDPARPATAAQIVTTVRQGFGELPSRRVAVTIPSGFTVPLAAGALPMCTSAQEAAEACPPESRVGNGEATVSGLITLRGGVFFGQPTSDGRFKIIVQLDNPTFAQHVTQEGFISLTPAGIVTVFDNLPSFNITRFILRFDGGDRALVTTPKTCGDFPFTAAFTASDGRTASATAPVSITGCSGAAVSLTRVSVTPAKVRAGRRPLLRFRLSGAAPVRVLVKGRRTVVDRRLAGRAGTNSLHLPRTLRTGRYRVAVFAGGAVRKTSFRVVRG